MSNVGASVYQGSVDGFVSMKMMSKMLRHEFTVTRAQPSLTPIEDFGPTCKTMLSSISVRLNDII